MKNIDKLLHLSQFLYNEYTELTFNPKNDFQKKILYNIIRHDADERFDLTLTNIEVDFLIHQVRGYYGSHTDYTKK